MKFCTLHLSRSHDDHWGATDSANRARCNWPQLLRCPCQRSFCLFFFSGEANKITASLQLTLFSDSFRVSQNLNPVKSKMLFSQPFLCLPLLFPLCTVPCKIILASPAHLDTWSHDEMENISWMKFLFRRPSDSRKLSPQKFHKELACVFTAHCASKNADWNQQQLTDGGILPNRNCYSTNHSYCFLWNQKEVQILAFFMWSVKGLYHALLPKTDYRDEGRRHDPGLQLKRLWDHNFSGGILFMC